MADRNIVTQAGIEDLKFALDELAANLSRHVNASLSKAHGVTVINGFVDSFGNDFTVYRDSSGAVVGNYFVLFQVNNTNYYAPANLTALAGQDSSNGSVDTSSEGEFTAQTGATWVTDYTSDQVPQAQSMNNDVLIPHTQQPARSVHGGLSVVAQATFNNLGHQVGTHVIKFSYNNIVYDIPVSYTFGIPRGPVFSQQPVSITNTGSSITPSHRLDTAIFFVSVTGTGPFTYLWQISGSPDMSGAVNLPLNSGSDTIPNYPGSGASSGATSLFSAFPLYYAGGAQPNLGISAGGPGIFYFRCKVTGPGGTSYSNTCFLAAVQNPS